MFLLMHELLGVFLKYLYKCLCRNLSAAAVRSLFLNEGKHGGEATVEAVELIADFVKRHHCRLHPNTIEVCRNHI